MERQGWKANIDWKKQKNVMQGDGRTGKLQSQLVQAHHTAANSPVQDYTHFVSLPLAFHHGLANKLINFRNKILRSEASSSEMGLKLKGIDESIFINPKTFHLTVVMLRLSNDGQVKTAAEVLQRASSKVLDALENRPVSIRLKGLECMRGSFAKAWVLYAPVEEVGGEGRLLLACQVIIDAFVEAGFADKDPKHKLKLHATIMHAGYKKREKNTKAEPFDARDIYNQYGLTEWGECIIREAHLSQRFVYDESGYYHCCASIPFQTAQQTGAGLGHGRGSAPAQPPFQGHGRAPVQPPAQGTKLSQGRGRALVQPLFQAWGRSRGQASTQPPPRNSGQGWGWGHPGLSEPTFHSTPFLSAHQPGAGLGQGIVGRAPAQPPFQGWGRSHGRTPAQPSARGRGRGHPGSSDPMAH